MSNFLIKVENAKIEHEDLIHHHSEVTDCEVQFLQSI